MGRPFLYYTNVFKSERAASKRGEYDKFISILSRIIADKGRAFSIVFRFLNVDNYSFPIGITI